MKNIENYEVQILYTEIDSIDDGTLTFTDHTFQVDDNAYFYPASTVKFPMAVMAASYMDSQKDINIDTPYKTSRDSLLHTVAEDITQIFTVSDNEAYNRLYELVGRDYVNTRFRENVNQPIRIAHRLSTENTDAAERTSFKFYPGYEAETIVIQHKKDSPISNLSITGMQKGQGYIEDGISINKAFDFSEKNYFPLLSQHSLMKHLLFPEYFDPSNSLSLKPATRERLIESMKTLPREARYDESEFYDSYVKFFIYGDSKDRIPETLHSYNKVGYAYGTLTETAYIKDVEHNIQFILSATILVNKNGVFNDDTYEYTEVGIPFLAQLGREIYRLEMENK